MPQPVALIAGATRGIGLAGELKRRYGGVDIVVQNGGCAAGRVGGTSPPRSGKCLLTLTDATAGLMDTAFKGRTALTPKKAAADLLWHTTLPPQATEP